MSVSDAEDTQIDDADVVIQPAMGHDEHAHPADPLHGRTGTVATGLGGHGEDMNIFYAIDGRYTDPAARGHPEPDRIGHHPDLPEAAGGGVLRQVVDRRPWPRAATPPAAVRSSSARTAHGSASSRSTSTASTSTCCACSRRQVRARSSSATAARRRADRDGRGARHRRPVLPDVAIDVSGLGDRTLDLYLVFTGESDIKLNFTEAIGQGSSPAAAPSVAITAPEQGDQFDPGADRGRDRDRSRHGRRRHRRPVPGRRAEHRRRHHRAVRRGLDDADRGRALPPHRGRDR